MRKGIQRVLIFYGIGFGIAGIISASVEQHYTHGPALQHFILFLMFVAGIVWTLISLLLFLTKKRTLILKDIILTNTIIISSILIVLAVMLKS